MLKYRTAHITDLPAMIKMVNEVERRLSLEETLTSGKKANPMSRDSLKPLKGPGYMF